MAIYSVSVLVCGGRDFQDVEFLHRVMAGFMARINIDRVIEGDARGADRIAGHWARRMSIENVKFPADWDRHSLSAGPIRNSEMLETGKPDIVVAFLGGRGTDDMVQKARGKGVPVFEVGRDDPGLWDRLHRFVEGVKTGVPSIPESWREDDPAQLDLPWSA